MKKGCLSEEIFEVISNEESHLNGDPSMEKQEEFLRMTKHSILQNSFFLILITNLKMYFFCKDY